MMPFLTALETTPARSLLKSFFANDPIVDSLPVPEYWSLAEPLVYRSTQKGVTVVCPIGMTTDLASTPKVLQFLPFLDIDGLSRPCGILHDCGYRLGREKGKEWWDEILREACIDVGMKRWQAFAYYWAVRIFGSSGWAQDGANAAYGDPRRSNFIEENDYRAFIASGGSLLSQETT